MQYLARYSYDMLGRNPDSIQVERPLQNGVIAKFDVTEAMLRFFIRGVTGRRPLFKPRVMISTPRGVTSVEERAVHDAAMQAGAGAAYLIPEPLAAAYGAGMPIGTPTGNMVVDFGGGTTEAAVVSMYDIVVWSSIRTASLASSEVTEAIEDPLSAIITTIRSAREQTPPELASDIIDRGIVLTGGGAQLRFLAERLTQQLGVPCYVAENPLACVALGAGRALANYQIMRRSLPEIL